MSTNKNDNKENPSMDELKTGDVVVYEEKDHLVVDIQENIVTLQDQETNEQVEIDLDEMTKAASTVNINNPHGNLSQMTNSIIQAVGNMSSSEQTEFFSKVQALYGKGKDHGTGDQAGKNKKSVEHHGGKDTGTPGGMAAKVKSFQKEDLDAILGDEDGLSEEFKEKIAALFEASVALRVSAVEAELQEQFDEVVAELEEQKLEDFAELQETLEDNIDQYLTHAANEWLAENEVAVESTLRTSMAESFMFKLHDLLAESCMDLPEADVPAVEALAERVEELEDALNESINEKMELVEAIDQFTADSILEEVSEGLATTQAEKFATLVEGFEFDGDVDAYKSKLEVVKEKHFSKSSPKPTSINEEVEIEQGEKEEKHVNPMVQRYAAAISRTSKT